MQVSTQAVHTQGVGYGIWFGDGCVWGDVFDGEIRVEISGPIHDGGCLAVRGH